MKKLMLVMLVGVFLISVVSADVVIPTVTNVYFEKGGEEYSGKIDFTIKGYGYTYEVGPFVEKKPGSYTPEVVYSFSATYNNYGDKIYENYYRNYRQIDYYELEGKTADGKTFIIKNIESIPTSCVDVNPEENEEYKTCLNNLVKPTFVDPSTQPVGTTREDYMERIWTKGEDGMWTSPSAPETSWGNIIWAETDKDRYNYNEAKKQCDEIINGIYNSGDYYSQECELRFNLDNAEWDYSIKPIKKGFFEGIICFFKKLFSGSC